MTLLSFHLRFFSGARRDFNFNPLLTEKIQITLLGRVQILGRVASKRVKTKRVSIVQLIRLDSINGYKI